MKPPVKFYWKGPHHGYIGIAFFIFGIVFLYLNWGNNLDFLNPYFILIAIVGVLFTLDDLVEHTITEDTFLRIIWNYIMRKKK